MDADTILKYKISFFVRSGDLHDLEKSDQIRRLTQSSFNPTLDIWQTLKIKSIGSN